MIAVRGRDASKTVALGGRRETRRALTIVAAEGEDAPAPAVHLDAMTSGRLNLYLADTLEACSHLSGQHLV